MEILNMSKKKYNGLERVKLDKSIVNTEAKLLLTELRGKIKVFKNLYVLSGPNFANKLLTLEYLDNYKEFLPSSFVLPDGLCSVQGSIKGFTMPYIKGDVLQLVLNNRSVDMETQIHYLKEVGKLLEKLEKIRSNSPLDSIYINDLHAGNFMVEKETGELKTVDIDSCKIGDNKPFPSKYLSDRGLLTVVPSKYHVFTSERGYYTQYNKYNYKVSAGYIEPDSNSDIYCYIIMILNYLYGDNINNLKLEEFYNYMNYLEHIGIDMELIANFISIVDTRDNEIPVDVLDTITYKHVALANKKIYKSKCK